MRSRPYPKAFACGLLLTLLTLPRGAQAQTPVSYQFTGTVTGVEDTHNWLQNTYAVGAPITGTVTYFSSGVTNIIVGFPQTKQYAFGAQKPQFSLDAGGQEVKYKSGTFWVTV